MRIIYKSQRTGKLSVTLIADADVEVNENQVATLNLYDAFDDGGWFEVHNLSEVVANDMLYNLATTGYVDLTDYTVEEYDRDDSTDGGDEDD